MPQEIPLLHCKVGQKVRVSHLLPVNEKELRKLSVFGILPGVEIEILQKYPICVLRIGYTEVALDYEIGKSIVVRS